VYSVEDNSTDLTDEMICSRRATNPGNSANSEDLSDLPSPLETLGKDGFHGWYVVAATPSANSLSIKVEIVTTDTQETKSVNGTS